MSDFQDEIIEICEDLRELRGQPDEMILLEHSTGDSEDYEELLAIESGWNLEPGTDGPVIQIVETEIVTAAILERVNAFVVDELVYKIAGTDKQRPFGEPLLWTFPATTTGESFVG